MKTNKSHRCKLNEIMTKDVDFNNSFASQIIEKTVVSLQLKKNSHSNIQMIDALKKKTEHSIQFDLC